MLEWLKARFIKREYIKLSVKGSGSCFCTPLDACDMIEDADEKGAYQVESVWMTPRQFDAIPEFMGF